MSVLWTATKEEKHMNQLEFARIHEMQFHGDIRFHLRLHEMTKEPLWPEQYRRIGMRSMNFWWLQEVLERLVLIQEQCILSLGIFYLLMLGLCTPLGEMKKSTGFLCTWFWKRAYKQLWQWWHSAKIYQPSGKCELIFRDHFKKDDAIWPHIEEPLEEIRALCSQEMTKNELLIKSNLLRIWHYLCLDAEATSFTLKKKDDERVRMIKQILQYIQENYARNLTLCGLAAYFHMSEGQFCRFFKSQIGNDCNWYLNYYRIGVACDMLKDGILSISEIATECGYNNISYFNRTFRRYMHCTPGEYQKR